MLESLQYFPNRAFLFFFATVDRICYFLIFQNTTKGSIIELKTILADDFDTAGKILMDLLLMLKQFSSMKPTTLRFVWPYGMFENWRLRYALSGIWNVWPQAF